VASTPTAGGLSRRQTPQPLGRDLPTQGKREASTPQSPTPCPYRRRFALYRALWLAALFSNIGTYMYNIAADWVMTGLSASPMLAMLLYETIDGFLIRSMVFVSLFPTSVMLHRRTAAGLPA
jgi:hypothetical protein